MDNFMGMTQGDLDQQERVTKLLLRAIKEIFPSFLEETKDSICLKKALQGDGSWLPVKEILGWILNKKQGTLRHLEKCHLEMQELLNISSNQRRISVDMLRRLIGKLCSLYLAVPGVIGHLYHLQTALTCAGTSRRGIYLERLPPGHWALDIFMHRSPLSADLHCGNCAMNVDCLRLL